MTLRTLLQHRLRKRKNKQFLNWIAETGDKSFHGHHVVKGNDLLIAKIPADQHLYRENEDYELQLVLALENVFNYVETLQRTK